MQAPLLIPVQTEASAQQARVQIGEKGPTSTPSATSAGSGPFRTHLEQHGAAEPQQVLSEAEPSTRESTGHAAEIAERGQDAPEEEHPVNSAPPSEQVEEANSEKDSGESVGLNLSVASGSVVLRDQPAGSTTETPEPTRPNSEALSSKPGLQLDSQLRQEAPRVVTTLLQPEQPQPANGPVSTPAVKGPSVEVSPLPLAHSDDARLARDSGRVPVPVAQSPSQQNERERGPSVARVVDRSEKMVSPQARHSRAPAVHDMRRAPSASEAPTQEKKPVGSMRSLAQLLEAGSVRLEASPQRALEPAVARARLVQQAIAQEQVAHAAQAIRSGGTGQPTNLFASMPGAEAATGDARGAVLSEVLARSGETLQPGERATMIAARGLTALASQRGGSLAIRLDPPSLGEIAIRMNVIDGVVRAEMTAASSAARVLMEKGIDVLRCSLESRGLTVERLSIHGPIVASESHSVRSEGQQSQTQHQGGAREEGMNEDRRDAAGQQSRGRGGERQDRSFDENGESRRSRTTFKQVLDEDTT